MISKILQAVFFFLAPGLLISTFLIGCEKQDTRPYPRNTDLSNQFNMSEDMEGCVVIRLESAHYPSTLFAVKCDGKKTTSTTQFYGKGQRTTTITINGVEYKATPKEKKEK